jgi:hypothetical protein
LQFFFSRALQVLVYDTSKRSLSAVAASPRLRRWTLAAALLPLPPPDAAAGGALARRGVPQPVSAAQPAAALAVGLSDDSVLLYAVAFGAAEQQVRATSNQLWMRAAGCTGCWLQHVAWRHAVLGPEVTPVAVAALTHTAADSALGSFRAVSSYWQNSH